MSNPPSRPRTEPQPVVSSWDDLLAGVATPADWQARKADLRRRYLELIRDDRKPAKPPLDLRVHETVDVDGVYERRLISYAVEADERAHAFLAVPHGLTAPAPAVVSLHGTYAHGKEREAGLEENPEKAFLDHLARRGFVVIAPDHFVAGERIPPEGAYDTTRFYQRHPEWNAVGKSVYEHAIAIDVLTALACVDATRIAALGHSLGGHAAYFLAAYDSRVKVAVSNSGCAPFRHNSKVEAWARDHFYIYFKQMRAGLLRGELPPIDMHEIMALIAPRPFLDLSALNDLIAGDEPRLAGWTYRQRVLMLMKVMDAYELEGAAQNFAFFSHGQGHAAPHEVRQLMYAWLDKHLKGSAEVQANLVRENKLTNHGVASPVSESRGVVAAQDAQGRHLVLTLLLDLNTLGSLLVTDVESGETQQIWFPETTRSERWAAWAPYASLLSRNNRFYTFAGPTLLEFDIDQLAFTFHGVPAAGELCCVETAMADGPDGRIYAATHPGAHLISYDPATRELRDHGQLDAQEHYPNSLAVDRAGWLYIGIGTACWNLVGFNPTTGEIRSLVPESARSSGTARVLVATDGEVYAETPTGNFVLGDGAVKSVESVPARASGGGRRFQNREAELVDGRRLQVDLPERRLRVTERDGVSREVPINFISGGAIITSLSLGPDDCIYGSTAHPMHLVRYDPVAREIADLGAIKAIGGGNICAFATQGNVLVGPAYPWGDFYRYDPLRPFAPEATEAPNPAVLARFEKHITRPRACLAHPDGKHVIAAGFMDYGLIGGGLGIVNLRSGETTLLTHEQVVPRQSTITLKALPSGNLIGGTSVQAPGGGHATEKEGVLYVFDWKRRLVTHSAAPVPGAEEVFGLELMSDGRVCGVASGAQFFIYDLVQCEVVKRIDLSAYGALVRPSLLRHDDGVVYGVLEHAVFRVTAAGEVELIAQPPVAITAGLAIKDGRLYFGAKAEIWSCRI